MEHSDSPTEALAAGAQMQHFIAQEAIGKKQHIQDLIDKLMRG